MNAILLKPSVARAMGTAICLLLFCAFATQLRADKESPPAPSASAEHAADLALQLPIKAGTEESVQFEATVPGFPLVSAKLHSHPGTVRTRLLLGSRFTTRSVRGARLEVTLLDGHSAGAKTIHHVTHVEVPGPEQVRRKGHNLDSVRNWDAARALWFDVPIEAREAQALPVEVHLQ